MKNLAFLLLVINTLICGCSNNSVIYSNRSFEDIGLLAQERNKPFCIVLIDSNQNLSKDYISSLSSKYNFLTNKAVYNIVNVDEDDNKWYVKWLCPISLPLTCIFSPDGILMDIIPGAMRESFLYAENSVKQMIISNFHWPNRFQMQKDKVIPILYNILEHKNYIANGIYLSAEIDSLSHLLNYPYITYLKLSGELLTNDTIASISTSNQRLELETPYNLEIYKTEFLTAKRLINPHFNIENEPTIRIDKQTIQLGACHKNETIPIKIVLYNDGLEVLDIARIITSCSCIKNLNESNTLSLVSKDSLVLSFEFIPDSEGDISRSILIASSDCLHRCRSQGFWPDDLCPGIPSGNAQ